MGGSGQIPPGTGASRRRRCHAAASTRAGTTAPVRSRESSRSSRRKAEVPAPVAAPQPVATPPVPDAARCWPPTAKRDRNPRTVPGAIARGTWRHSKRSSSRAAPPKRSTRASRRRSATKRDLRDPDARQFEPQVDGQRAHVISPVVIAIRRQTDRGTPPPAVLRIASHWTRWRALGKSSSRDQIS